MYDVKIDGNGEGVVRTENHGSNRLESISGVNFPVSRIPVVNVAQVPQRSPLRYPGGKTWLIPHVREWLRGIKAKTLIEPFAGGGIVSLTAVMENLVPEVVMVEIDRDVSAFWRTALHSGGTLRKWIDQFKPTRDNVRDLETTAPNTVEEHGFRTLVLNRTRRGGILASGAALSKRGENGNGVASRWYPETLNARLNEIEKHAEQIIFLEGDGLRLLSTMLQYRSGDAAVFIDPPYTAGGGKKAGSRLYAHSKIDHAALFGILANSECSFLMTYDAAPEIIDLVRRHNFNAVSLTMKNTHHNRLPEIVITRKAMFS